MSPNYFGFALVSFGIAISPGASWMYVITSTVGYGRLGGLFAIAGNAAGILIHVLAALVGVTAVLQYSANTFALLKFFGAAYLLFLAVRTVRESAATSSSDDGSDRSLTKVFQSGVLVNATNPKAALLMLALLPQFVDVSSHRFAADVLVCGLIHVAVASCVLFLVSLVADIARNSLRNQTVDRTFRWTSAAILVGLGLKLLFTSA